MLKISHAFIAARQPLWVTGVRRFIMDAVRNTKNTNTNKNLYSAKFVDKTRQRRWVVIIFLRGDFFFFPRLISAVADWMSAILVHMVWPYGEVRMQVWNVLHAARWNIGRKNCKKKSPSGHHRTTCRAISSKARTDNRKKLVKQQYLLYMSG